MPIISQRIITDITHADGSRTLMYEYTPNVGDLIFVGPIILSSNIAATFDAEADMLSRIPGIEQNLIDMEINETFAFFESDTKVRQQGGTTTDWATYKVPPNHLTQPEFDRKILGLLMLVRDITIFREGYAFFLAMESRNGANKNARADNLGVPRDEYTLVDKRFHDVAGGLVLIDGDKGLVWETAPSEIWE